ncbi:hypothetical protein ACA910_006842 [Epithemia clementina (nom. ined.)]
MSFNLKSVEMVLTPITEEESVCDEGTTEKDVLESKMRTELLAAAAVKEMKELASLLGKVNTSTATTAEEHKLLSAQKKLDKLKSELKTAKKSETDIELSYLRSSTARSLADVRMTMKKKDIRSVIRAVSAAESVDLCFVVDCTSSMQPYIASVKNSIRDIVFRVRATNANLRLRLAFVAYRGVEDDKKGSELLDFVTSVDAFLNFMQLIPARNGERKYGENMAGGIQRANSLCWEQPTRVCFIIADMSCHGDEFLSGTVYPSGTPGIDIVLELKTLQAKTLENGTMTLNFGRITSTTDNMLSRFKEHYGIEISVVDVKDSSKMTASVTTGLRKSIFKTMTVSGGAARSVSFMPVVDPLSGTSKSARLSKKSYMIEPKRPSFDEWKHQAAVKVNLFRNRGIKKINDLQEPLQSGLLSFFSTEPKRTDRTKSSTMFMRRAAHPFAEGEIRIAFHAQLSRLECNLSNEKSSMVLKSYKHVGKGLNDRNQYLKQMEVSTIAHFLACKYNTSCERPSHCGMISLLDVCVVEEESEDNEKHGDRRFCAEEPLPVGTFTKFSNNTGHWDEDNLHETLLRFTDFTFQATNGYLMVTDLQGVQNGNSFTLTDPVILCKDIERFGNTNLGPVMMAKCIESTRALMKENDWH